MGVRATVQTTLRTGEVFADVMAGIMRGQNLAAERLLALSTEQVPKDTGELELKGQVVPATDAEEGAAVAYDAPQAARLHEHPEYHFSKKANPGAKGKYLEDPAMENKAELGDIIRKQAHGGS